MNASIMWCEVNTCNDYNNLCNNACSPGGSIWQLHITCSIVGYNHIDIITCYTIYSANYTGVAIAQCKAETHTAGYPQNTIYYAHAHAKIY